MWVTPVDLLHYWRHIVAHCNSGSVGHSPEHITPGHIPFQTFLIFSSPETYISDVVVARLHLYFLSLSLQE